MARKLEVEIVGDARSLQSALGSAGQTTQTFGSHLSSLAKTAGLVLGAGALGGIALTLKTGIAEWSQSSKVTAQTEAVIKSTGGAAGITAKQVDQLSGSLLRKSGVDDEAIKSGANMLLTFTNIRNEAGKGNDVFNQTTKTLLDMSVATGQDMPKAAVMLGKAINDPIAGIGALSRVGVTFTEGQKASIKAMVESGDTMGAQKVILGELQKEFGGSAEAVGKTLPGQISILKESFNNLAGDIVGSLVPTFQSIVTWTATNWPTIELVFKTVFGAIGDAIDFVKPYFIWFIQQSAQIVERVRADWPQIQRVIQSAMNTIRDIISGVVNIAEAIWSRFGNTIIGIVDRTFPAIVSVIKNAANIIAGAFQLLGDLLHGRWGEVWDDIKKIVSNALKAVVTIIKTAAENMLSVAAAIGRAILDGIKAGFESAWDSTKGYFTNKMHDLADTMKHPWRIHSPSQTAADDIGRPIAEGIILGYQQGILPLTRIVSDNLDSILVGVTKRMKAAAIEMASFAKPTSLLQDANAWQDAKSTADANAQVIDAFQQAVFAGDAGANRSGSPDDRLGAAGGAGSGDLHLTTNVQVEGQTLFTTVQKIAIQDLRAGGVGVPGVAV